MPTTLVTVTVSVPEDRISDLYSYAAQLTANPTASVSVEGEDRRGRARNGFGRNAVRSAYTGGVSDHWRPFLEALADKPDEWVAWTALYEQLGLTNRQAAGMLGAAERRCKGNPPYEKAWEDDEHWFRMPAETAKIVKELATQR